MACITSAWSSRKLAFNAGVALRWTASHQTEIEIFLVASCYIIRYTPDGPFSWHADFTLNKGVVHLYRLPDWYCDQFFIKLMAFPLTTCTSIHITKIDIYGVNYYLGSWHF